MSQITAEFWEEDDLSLEEGFHLGDSLLEEVIYIANRAEVLLNLGDLRSAQVMVQKGYDLVRSYDSSEIFTALS